MATDPGLHALRDCSGRGFASADEPVASRRPASFDYNGSALGAASSSCSYAAVAIARSVVRKGADFTAAMAFDGVICGHIQYAVIRDQHGIRYMNCGDWVESCTALVEHDDGHSEIIAWTDPERRGVPVPQIAPARAA